VLAELFMLRLETQSRDVSTGHCARSTRTTGGFVPFPVGTVLLPQRHQRRRLKLGRREAAFLFASSPVSAIVRFC